MEALADAQVDVAAAGEQITSVYDILEVSLGAGKCGIEQEDCVSCGGGAKGISFRVRWPYVENEILIFSIVADELAVPVI